MSAGVAVTTAAYLESQEVNLPEPSIRIAVNALLTKEEILSAVKVIKKSAESVLSS